MNILYDGWIYELQAAGGINRYFEKLITNLPDDFTPTLLLKDVREVNFPEHPRLRVRRLGRLRFPHVSYRLSLYLSRLEDFYQEVAPFRRYDLAHPTYYTLSTGRRMEAYACPLVITVHDMIHEIMADQMDPTGAEAEAKRKAIEAADRIICVSQNTKRDLLKYYRLPEERLSVIHQASDIRAELSHGPEPVPSRPFYLYVGSRARYKNFGGLLRAFAQAAPSRPGLALCVVGAPFTADEQRLVAELGLAERVEHYGHATDSHLAKLYRCSLALVYPSLYEGFGIPPLEAMSCGTVAVVAETSSLPEVVGDAGLLFDPRALDDLTDILLSLTENEALRRELIEKGRKRAEQFSWAKTVAQTVEVYRSLVG